METWTINKNQHSQFFFVYAAAVYLHSVFAFFTCSIKFSFFGFKPIFSVFCLNVEFEFKHVQVFPPDTEINLQEDVKVSETVLLRLWPLPSWFFDCIQICFWFRFSVPVTHRLPFRILLEIKLAFFFFVNQLFLFCIKYWIHECLMQKGYEEWSSNFAQTFTQRWKWPEIKRQWSLTQRPCEVSQLRHNKKKYICRC